MKNSMDHLILDIFKLGATKVAVLKDMSNKFKGVSITNSIEEISKELDSEWVLYEDTSDNWDAWHKECGFILLDFKGNEYQASERFLSVVKNNNMYRDKTAVSIS